MKPCIILKKICETGRDYHSFDLPCPAIMAGGIGGVSRRGWQYWHEGNGPMPAGIIPKDGEPSPEEPLTTWLRKNGSPGYSCLPVDLDREPCPTVMAGGMWGGNTSQYRIEDDGVERYVPDPTKPPYRVPSMPEIAALPWNGLSVVSTFSGCGGSCLGYRMAGFRVLWANEFVPAAKDSYRANAAPGSVLDGRDMRTVAVDDILRATGLAKGGLDLLDGSPPCQAFSTAGKREKGWGEEKTYEHGARQKNETLFDEYIRLLRGLMPRTFVAENVSGLVKGTAKGFFLDILRELKASGYRVEVRLLDAQWLGVPQARQRLIFVGVRDDLGLAPVFPKPLPYNYSVRDALPWISELGKVPGGDYAEKGPDHVWGPASEPSPTITATTARVPLVAGHSVEADIPRNVVALEGTNDFNGHRMSGTAGVPSPTIMVMGPHGGSGLVEAEADLGGSVYGKLWEETPIGSAHPKRFSLKRLHPDRPALTIGATGGSQAGPTHPFERRRFSIAELRRICGFPDDFVLTGSYAQQWERLGNSVPPVMMRHVAEAIRDRILSPSSDKRKGPPEGP